MLLAKRKRILQVIIMKTTYTFKRAFTIVELAVVIATLGILVGVTVFAFKGWQDSIAKKAVQSDLQMASNAMENAKNFSEGGYPSTIPSSTKSSPDITLSGGGFNDGTAYCIEGLSTKRSGVTSQYVTNTQSTPQNGTCSAPTGLVGHWKMNGNATDSSGNGNNGTPGGGVTATTGQNGVASNAYSFNGSHTGSVGVINAGTNTSLTFTDNFTISAWIRPTGYQLDEYFTLKNGIVARGPASTYNYALQLRDSTTVSFIKRAGTEGLLHYHFTVPSLTNAWSLVTATISSGRVTMYRNGAVVGSPQQILGNPIAGAANDVLYIGSATPSSRYTHFIGSIDDVRIYNRALPAADVAALYTAGAQ